MRLILTTILCSSIFLLAGAATTLAEGDYPEDIYYMKPVIGVVFSHQLHVEEFGMDCDSCHDGIFEMEARLAENEENFTMAGLADGEFCGACHDGDTAYDANTRCTTCHVGVIGYSRAHGLVNEEAPAHH